MTANNGRKSLSFSNANRTNTQMSFLSPTTHLPARVLAWAEHLALKGVTEVVAYGWLPAQTTAVVGLSQEVEKELQMAVLAADKVPVLRRASGGGAVILCPGVYCFGILAPPTAIGDDHRIHAAFRCLTAPLIEACQDWGVSARIAGISDLAAPVCSVTIGNDNVSPPLTKIAGCAQLRKRHAILVHGSLLVAADTDCFERYLRFPSAVPDYRAARSHANFCGTLKSLVQTKGREVPTCANIHTSFGEKCAARGWRLSDPPAVLPTEAKVLLTDKYESEDWNLRRKRPPRRSGR